MHQLIAALFALLVALCHHTDFSAHTRGTSQFEAQLDAATRSSSASVVLPDRYQLAHATDGYGYAETSCASCRRTSISYTER